MHYVKLTVWLSFFTLFASLLGHYLNPFDAWWFYFSIIGFVVGLSCWQLLDIASHNLNRF